MTLALLCVTLQRNKASKLWRRRGLFRNGNQTDYAAGVLRDNGGHRPVLPQERHRRQRLRTGRALCGPLAHRLRLRYLLFLRRGLCGLRRPVRLEVRHRRHLGGHRQRRSGLPAGLGGAGPPHPHHDPAPGQRHHARVFRQAVRLPVAENRRLGDYLHLPHPLHRQPVQHRLLGVCRCYGYPHRRLCDCRGLYGHRDQRLYPGHYHALWHQRGDFSGAEQSGRLYGGPHQAGPGVRRDGLRPGGRGSRSLRFLLRTRPGKPAGRGNPHLPGHLGPAPDGAEVLRHQKREVHQHRHGDFHPLCHGGVRGLLLPGGLRPAVCR